MPATEDGFWPSVLILGCGFLLLILICCHG